MKFTPNELKVFLDILIQTYGPDKTLTQVSDALNEKESEKFQVVGFIKNEYSEMFGSSFKKTFCTKCADRGMQILKSDRFYHFLPLCCGCGCEIQATIVKVA